MQVLRSVMKYHPETIDVPDYYECTGCNTSVGAELIRLHGDDFDAPENELGYIGSSDDSCENCQASLASGERYLPYEDGSDSHAYIECPSCKHKNIRYGFGEDDD